MNDALATPDPADATAVDLALACAAIGPKALYGGLLSCALAGIYAERQRAADALAEISPAQPPDQEPAHEHPQTGPGLQRLRQPHRRK